MDFAKNQLLKFGWKEGDGLGKTNQGIQAPLKANLKFDNTGLGHDKAIEFKNHWWERVYNDAASNIVVDRNDDDISMTVKDPNCVEITTNSYSTNKLQKFVNSSPSSSTGKSNYSNFLKVSTLGHDGHEKQLNKVEDSPTISNWEITPSKILTDEELLFACEGRTAHKGARHGLNSTGKLTRIAEQDNELLEKLKNNSDTKTSKKKKKYKNLEPNDLFDVDLSNLTRDTDYSRAINKKERRRKAKLDLQLATILSPFSLTEQNSSACGKLGIFKKKKKKKRKKKLPESETVDTTDVIIVDNNINKPPLAKKRKAETTTTTLYRANSDSNIDDDDDCGDNDLYITHKEKELKMKRLKNIDDDENLVIAPVPKKKRKKIVLPSTIKDESFIKDLKESSDVTDLLKGTKKKNAKKRNRHLLKLTGNLGNISLNDEEQEN